ncbi:MAG: hypothetical protein ABIH23_20165 [bacterium]
MPRREKWYARYDPDHFLYKLGKLGFFPFAGYDGDMFRSTKHKGKFLSAYLGDGYYRWCEYSGGRDSWSGRPYYRTIKSWGDPDAKPTKQDNVRIQQSVLQYLRGLK